LRISPCPSGKTPLNIIVPALLIAAASVDVPPPTRVVDVSNANRQAYLAHYDVVTWSRADSLARAAGGRLVAITDSTEAAIVAVLTTAAPSLWTVDEDRNELGGARRMERLRVRRRMAEPAAERRGSLGRDV
jgi:hypothetical protein